MDSNQNVFNGINGSNGRYVQPALSARQIADIAKGGPVETDERHQGVLKRWWTRLSEKFFAPLEGIDSRDLAQTGWGVIFPFADGEDATKAQAGILKELRPLLDLRREQAGRIKEQYYREFVGPWAYRPNDTKQLFLGRSRATPGSPADPEKVPYYLLIVGDPETIPYRFQYQLDVEYAVGRIHFDSPEEYARYARSLVEVESRGLTRPRRAAFFGVRNQDDAATSLSTEHLVQPLAGLLEGRAELTKDWQFSTILGADATKERLGRLLGGDETPSFLFTAGHGMEFLRDDARQRDHQGALLCGDWPGPLRWKAGQPIPPEHYYWAGDLREEADVRGLITFHFACYGAGTPRLDDFPDLAATVRDEIAPRAFQARLPQRLLTHPRGGALAVVGHVERAWGCSFIDATTGEQLGTFQGALQRLLGGYPVGAATEWLNQRYSALSTELSVVLEDVRFGKQVDDFRLASMWTANNDARSYVIVGDPAVRLPAVAPAVAGDAGAVRAGASSLDAGRSSVASTPRADAESPPPPSSVPRSGSPEGGGSSAGPGSPGTGFGAPEGYIDLTHYAFHAPDGLRRLVVQPATGLGGLDDLLHAARAYRDQVVDLLGASVVQDVTPGTRPDGADVATLSLSCPADDRLRVILERVGLVRFADGGGVQVSFVSAPDDPQAESLFRRALNSARPAGPGDDVGPLAFRLAPAATRTPEGAAPGSIQRAGAVTLDVPEGLRPPTLYHFASVDGGVRLSLEADPGTGVGTGTGSIPFAAPTARGAGGLFGRVALAQGDLGPPQRYEMMEGSAPTGPVAFAPAVGPAEESRPVDSREAVIGGVRVRLSARSESPERARQALESFAARWKRP